MLRPSPDIARVRADLPAVTAVAYLNTGTYGPLPRAAYEVMAARERLDFERGRAGGGGFQEMMAARAEVRRDAGRILGAPQDEIALTLGTTHGMNYALWGLNWQPEDEIVVTNLEHIGGLATAYVLQHRLGVRVRFADCHDPARVVDAIRAELSPRTRAVAFSHVAWGDGYVFPVADIAEAAHRAGALVVVDGAQSAGAVPVDVKALGVDAYAAPGQKWLCGPGGTGALYVSAVALDRLYPSFAAGGSFAAFDEFGSFTVQPNARRFEMGAGFAPAVLGLRASLGWLLAEVDLEWAYRRVTELADYARAQLAGVEGVTVRTPVGTPSGLTNFAFAGWEPAAVVEELGECGVVIRSIRHPEGLRVSTGFYNDQGDIDRLVAALREVRRLTPHPPRAHAPA
jgi:L-cysteine/cystine lyase